MPSKKSPKAKKTSKVSAKKGGGKESELTESLQRLQAEFANFRKRQDKEMEVIRERAAENLIRDLLPTLDNFERAIDTCPEDLNEHEWMKGVEQVGRALVHALSSYGLQKIETAGCPFNPEYHEAVMRIDGVEGLVLQELEPGYMLNGKVIRAAKVAVGHKE